MSVRKVYQLLFDGSVVVSGSYATVSTAYKSVCSVLKFLGILKDHTLVVAFVPAFD